mmetsp:Transcript_27117/g.67764  ORF Transcript_27117/g.67764 Transcript_27117/m.67764 type:complete len:235 (+) Transcript_27117:1082-1786(+)
MATRAVSHAAPCMRASNRAFPQLAAWAAASLSNAMSTPWRMTPTHAMARINSQLKTTPVYATSATSLPAVSSAVTARPSPPSAGTRRSALRGPYPRCPAHTVTANATESATTLPRFCQNAADGSEASSATAHAHIVRKVKALAMRLYNDARKRWFSATPTAAAEAGLVGAPCHGCGHVCPCPCTADRNTPGAISSTSEASASIRTLAWTAMRTTPTQQDDNTAVYTHTHARCTP